MNSGVNSSKASPKNQLGSLTPSENQSKNNNPDEKESLKPY
jgi:hypothetical protein